MTAGEEPSRLYKFIHFWVLVGRSFVRNRCPLRASALSYTTLLALIPMLAVAMSVTTSVLKKQGQQQIEHLIYKFVANIVPPSNLEPIPSEGAPPPAAPDTNAPSSPIAAATNSTDIAAASTNEVAATTTNAPVRPAEPVDKAADRLTPAQKRVAEQIYGAIQRVQSGAIAGIGMLLLVYAAIRMLSQVESTFNDIWGVTRGRSWWMSIVLYWTTITLGPMLLAGALGLASGPHFQSTQKFLMAMPKVGALTFKLFPLLLLWILFTLFYKTVPNTKVHFNAALVGGLVGGTAWHVNNLLGFLYVSRVVTYSKMYGGIGMVPVFMLGLYLSWLILLFGAQVAYAFQNRELYFQEKLVENVNQRGREFIALRLMTCIGQRFERGQKAPSVLEMSQELGIPTRLIQQVLQVLIAAHLVTEVSGAEPAYSPARPLDLINAHHVLMAMRALQGQELVTKEEPVREEVYGEFARIQEAEKQAASSITMLALVNRAQARLELTPPPAAEEEIKVSHALVPPDATKEAPLAAAPTPAPTADAAPEDDEFIEVPLEKMKPENAPQPPPPAIVEPMKDEERDFPL